MECQLDGGGFSTSTCTSPKTFPDLPVGGHTFEVRAIDFVGNVDPTPASFMWTILTPAQATRNVIDQLDGIVQGAPGTPLADKLEDASAKVEVARDEFEKTPPDNQAGVATIEGAVGDLQAAVNDGLLDPVEGAQLMDQLAEIARVLAVEAINVGIAEGGDSDVIADAQQALDDGDALRALGQAGDLAKFKDAVNKYKDALAKAECVLV